MPDGLDLVFQALADPTRRAILERLAATDLTVGEIAEPFPMTLQAVSKHLKVLERAGLVVRGTDAQWRTAGLDPRPLAQVSAWIRPYERFWTQRPAGPGRGAGGDAAPVRPA